MEDTQRVKIIASIDIVVAVIIIILGVSCFFLYMPISENNDGMIELYDQWAEDYEMENPFLWLKDLPLLIIIIGLIFVVYGSERLINNVLKILTNKKKKINNLNLSNYPTQPPKKY